jgi:hypothetical protein
MRRFLNVLRQFGFDPLATYRAFRGIPRFFSNYFFYSIKAKKLPNKLSPITRDFLDSAGSSDGHYFWQDLICAQWIFSNSPLEHFDVGSRIDGFIAHVASFRRVVMLDIRQVDSKIKNLEIIQGNAQESLLHLNRKFDSVSSLHSIEHFGLGRYGDSIDPLGHEKGLRNISELVTDNGLLYVSFPIGGSSVEFNAQRIIDPLWPINLLQDFELLEFVLIPWCGEPNFQILPELVDKQISGQAGLYKFRRIKVNGS